ncbi:hypothetical protein [Armatimonas rosea]|uniref:Uncharacterized protein n=1 Tax=Armatimonas rosea TaxID=685828 RepID=A0A7W9WAD8_ARMRO|nr:hypothetical protein [Armatimonas rosea]MBB6053507.1 hypothetical protein [Armatimonas rosea]
MVPDPEFYWHTSPLQFVPAILSSGALVASAYPRPRALARRRKLGLEGVVHLSFTARTPLLTDKCQRGYPHVLFAFDPAIAELPGAGYLKWNTMRWAHREEFIPIVDPAEKATFRAAWRAGSYPSAELLIPKQLALNHATALYLASQAEADWLMRLSLPTPPMTIDPERFPPGPPHDLTAFHEWADSCERAGELLPPLEAVFD